YQIYLNVTTNTSGSAIANITKDTSMVSIATKTTNGTEITGSPVFISGRTALKIPKMLASDHEVTQGEYEVYCKYGGTTPSSTYGMGSNYPAYFVSWYDAVVYCNLRSMAEGLTPVYSVSGKTDPSQWTNIDKNTTTGRLCAPSPCSWSVTIDYTKTGWRIPYEAEWEYLARGGNITNSGQYTYSGGNTPTSVAWYEANATDNKTHPVGKKTKNALNLHDMSGNVWEWTSDFHITPMTTTTPITGPASPGSGYSGQRVTRGGGYRSDEDACKLSNRYYSAMTYRGDDMGFRIVRTLP
ncbi:MAG: formylglycine-generating enzyme family protein, partial [Treponema sp.]|nr:formylglycine-generating enzyme family protein [Treponema sp.]